MKMKPFGTASAQIVERQRAMDRQMSAMAATIRALEARVAELSRLLGAQESMTATPDATHLERTKPEVVAAITAAATAFLGKAARLRSARLVHGGTWAQQGRVTVHTSHNLRRKG